jgi:hypothetical protein
MTMVLINGRLVTIGGKWTIICEYTSRFERSAIDGEVPGRCRSRSVVITKVDRERLKEQSDKPKHTL